MTTPSHQAAKKGLIVISNSTDSQTTMFRILTTTFNRACPGAIFHVLDGAYGTEVFVKTSHDTHNAVNLANGNIYYLFPDRQVGLIPHHLIPRWTDALGHEYFSDQD